MTCADGSVSMLNVIPKQDVEKIICNGNGCATMYYVVFAVNYFVFVFVFFTKEIDMVQ